MRSVGVVVAIAIVVGLAPVAHARDGIVIESYGGPRPADASKVLEPLLAELAQRGFEAGDGVGRIYEAKVSRPRQANLPADFAKQLEAGQQAYIRGNYGDAVAKLQPLIDTAHDNSGAFAKNQALRQSMLDGLIALALAQDRSGDPKAARATLGELARSFPDAQVLAGAWGANAAKLYAEVQRDLKQQTQGRLIVKASTGAEVYVNERFEQNGTSIKSVLPGEYRIFVRDGAKQSRTYRVQVGSAVDATVSIDLDLDAAIHSSPGWTGLAYAAGEDRERAEAKHAAAFANAIDERAIVVVGIDSSRSVIFGALINLAGRDERRASIPLASISNSKLQALARFLAGDPASPELDVIVGAGATGIPTTVGPSGPIGPHEPSATGRWGWPILTGVVALGAIGVGVYLFKIDGTCRDGSSDPNCPDLRNTRTPALLALGGGAVLAGLTIYLIVTRPATAPRRTAYVVPTSGGATAGVSLSF